MKKFTLLSLAFIVIFLQTNALYSQTDWTKYTPVPCDDPLDLLWDGPNEYQICYGESDLIQCENCCYKVIYYDNLDNSNYPPQYKISVVGIYWEGLECQDCDKEDIIRAFYNKHWAEKLAEPLFSEMFRDPISQLFPPEIQQDILTPGRCLNIDDYDEEIMTLCNESRVCCNSKYHIWLDTLCQIDSITNFPEVNHYMIQDSCNSYGCGPYCHLYPFADINDTTAVWPDSMNYCQVDCEGDWENKSFTINNYGNCQGCNVTFIYRTRNTTNCVPQNYYEISLDQVSLSSVCEFCNIDGTQLFNVFLDSALYRYGKSIFNGIPPLELPKCDTNVRVAHASCWGFFVDFKRRFNEATKSWEWIGHNEWSEQWQDSIFIIDQEYVYRACPGSDCCWATFVVCAHPPNGTISRSYYQGSSISSESCSFSPAICDFLCDVSQQPSGYNPTKIIERNDLSFNFKTNIFPNPSNGLLKIEIESEYKGNIEFRVYDNNSNILLNNIINKSEFQFTQQLDFKKYSNGIYHYKLIVNHSEIHSGNFNIIK